jgi:hypothetical protein
MQAEFGKGQETFPAITVPIQEENIKMDSNVWTGFIWLRIGTSGGLL